MIKEIYALLAFVFIIWELRLIFNDRLLLLYINNTKKKLYPKHERLILTLYTVYMFGGLIFPDRLYFIAILLIKLVVDLLLNLNIQRPFKYWILRIDSFLAALLMFIYVYIVVWQH